MAYSGLDVQHINSSAFSDPATLVDLQEFFEPWQSFEPLGGLGRDEVAELVAVIKRAEVHGRGGGSPGVTTPGTFSAVLSMDSSVPFRGVLEADETTDEDRIAGLDEQNSSTIDIDILDRYRLWAGRPVDDDVNGVGVPMSGSQVAYTLPLRSWYGQGPVVDRHDELFLHWGYQIQSEALGFAWHDWTALVWDVSER